MRQAPRFRFLSLLWLLAAAGWVGTSEDAAAGKSELPPTLTGHGGPIMAIAVDPETNQALTASFDYSVILWSLEGGSGAVKHRLIGHDASVNDVAFVPGARRAISVSDDGTAIVWDLQSASVIERFKGSPDRAVDVAVSADGRFAAIARWDHTAWIIDLVAMKVVHRLEGHAGNVNAVAFARDKEGALYTASHDGTVRAWDVASGDDRAMVVDHGWGINEVLMLGDALIYGGLDGTVARVALDKNDDEQQLAKSEAPVLALAADALGDRVAAGFGDGRILVFDTSEWQVIEEYTNPYGPIWGIAFADTGGSSLYYSGLDDFASLWQVRPREPFEPVLSTFPRRFQASADMSAGELQFQRKCSVCHTLEADDKNRAGPTLYGLFGRRAGTVPGYSYSEGLRNSGIVWSEETIGELFDHGPDVVTPGSKMPLQRLTDAEQRNALIGFLKEATMPNRQGVKAGTGE
jgi:cytochrome c